MKETFYFSHDYNARNDEKIKRLIRKHWLLWYGIYWAIIEDLYQNANELQFDCEGIAYDMRVETSIVTSVIMDFELFETNISFFSSNSVWERLQQRLDKSAKARQSAKARWGKKNANAWETQSEWNAIKESKGKESKIKESKHKYWEYKNILLLDREKEKIIKDYSEDIFYKYIKILDEWIQMKGYKYKDHNLAIRNWINRDNVKKDEWKKGFEKKDQNWNEWL